MTIGERIGALRKERNISQSQLAEAVGVSRQAVSKWENSQSTPDASKIILLAQVLETEVEYLATGVKPVYEPAPVIVNVVEKVDKVVEKPVIRKVYRTKYLRNPIEFSIVGGICFVLGLIVGHLIW